MNYVSTVTIHAEELRVFKKKLSCNIAVGSINNCTQILGRISKTYLRVSETQSVVLRKVANFSDFVLCTVEGISKDLHFTQRHVITSQKNRSLSNIRCQNLDLASTRYCCRIIPSKRH